MTDQPMNSDQIRSFFNAYASLVGSAFAGLGESLAVIYDDLSEEEREAFGVAFRAVTSRANIVDDVMDGFISDENMQKFEEKAEVLAEHLGLEEALA